MDVLIFCIVASERHKGNYNRGLTMIVKNIVCSNNVLTIEKKGKGDLIFFLPEYQDHSFPSGRFDQLGQKGSKDLYVFKYQRCIHTATGKNVCLRFKLNQIWQQRPSEASAQALVSFISSTGALDVCIYFFF